MTYEHIGDSAELYALGALADDERAAIEAHLHECSECACVVASAERDVALIASMEARQPAPPELGRRIDAIVRTAAMSGGARVKRFAWPLPAALAAALVVGLLPSAYFWSQSQVLHREMMTQSAAVGRLASSPHRTAVFHTAQGDMPGEVAYAPDGSWYVVVVRGASKSLAVAWMHDGERTMLGSATPRGNLAMLYLPKSHRMDRLALMDGDRVIAEATLSWQRTPPGRQGGRSG
jgi:anti-sigma factor RsiW